MRWARFFPVVVQNGEISAGSGNDQYILIGNSSAYDGDLEALDALMEAWTSGDSFDARWQAISSLAGESGTTARRAIG